MPFVCATCDVGAEELVVKGGGVVMPLLLALAPVAAVLLAGTAVAAAAAAAAAAAVETTAGTTPLDAYIELLELDMIRLAVGCTGCDVYCGREYDTGLLADG